MLSLNNNYNVNIVKLMINNKTVLNQRDIIYFNTPLMQALRFKKNINMVKLLINKKSDINQKYENGRTSFQVLFKNYSEKNIALILSFLNYNIIEVFNSNRISINDSNYKFFTEKLEITELSKKDNYN